MIALLTRIRALGVEWKPPHWRLLFTLVSGLGLAPMSSRATPLILDDFNYATTPAAQTAWVGGAGPAVNMLNSGAWGAERVMVANCDFATRETRCFWDRQVALDLSPHAVFELEVYAPNPAAISSFTLYFRSGGGWYGASLPLTRTGWQTLRFSRGDFTAEGTPAGWQQIDQIRLSPWKARSENTFLAFRELRAFTPTVLVVRDTTSSNPDVVQETVERHLAWLGSYNIDCGVITRTEVEAGLLQQSQLAILPYNETVSETEMSNYESFAAAGGKLIVYYQLPGRLAALLRVQVTGWMQGNFATWHFADPNIANLPTRVQQASWNITTAVPGGPQARVTATWENAQGQETGQAAWLASDRGFFMSHILLGDDADAKSFALLCLTGSLLPDVWPAAATGAINQIGRVGPYLDYDTATSAIHLQAAPTLRAHLVESELLLAATHRTLALAEHTTNHHAQAVVAAHTARAHLLQAYALSLKPTYPEVRAFWEHHATGPYPGNWPAAMEALATHQFNAVFVNLLWGGLAHYNSAYLPHSAEFNQYGDQITACVNAAHARGLQVHVWKVCWNLLGAPQTFINSMRAAQRTQVSSAGTPTDWLCPSHPDNFALETNSLLEVVRNYDVDGLHFDYIRYPDADHCYCSGCATRFQAQTGLAVANWPAEVLTPGALRTAFLDWRRAQITHLVEVVYAQVKALKPQVQVSAAVWPDAPGAYDGVGQDWRLWVTNGVLDFVCPMDYSTTAAEFVNTVSRQLEWVGGRMPMYPGIGAWQIPTDVTLVQLQATRAANTGGFVVFELSPESVTNLLPVIGAGATAADEPDLDQDELPDSWELKWFGNLTTAGRFTNFDGNRLNDYEEYVAGLSPTNALDGLQFNSTLTHQQLQLAFVARGTDVPGYRNATRYYCLETTAAPQSGWLPVPGFAAMPAAPGVHTVTCEVPDPAGQAFYRLRVWLQQQP